MGGQPAHRGEIADDDHAPAGLHRQAAHPRVGSRVRIVGIDETSGIQGTVRAQTRHPVLVDAIVGGEITADVNVGARGINHDRPDRPVGPLPGVERVVDRAVGIQPGDAIAGGAVERGEITRDDDFVVRLNGHGQHRIVRTGTGIEGGVQRTIRVQPRNARPVGAIDLGEHAADYAPPGEVGDHLVGMEGDHVHRVVRTAAQPGEDGVVHRAIDVQHRDAIAGQPVHRGEVTANQPASVQALAGQRVGEELDRQHLVVGPNVVAKRRVDGAGGRAGGRLVVLNGQRRRRVATTDNARAAGRIGQRQLNDAVQRSVHSGVINDRDCKGAVGLPR